MKALLLATAIACAAVAPAMAWNGCSLNGCLSDQIEEQNQILRQMQQQQEEANDREQWKEIRRRQNCLSDASYC